MYRRTFLALAITMGAVLGGLTKPAWALDEAAATRFIEDVIKKSFVELNAAGRTVEQRRKTAHDLIDRYADVGQVAEGLLGRFWARATPDERTRFQAIFVDYMLSG